MNSLEVSELARVPHLEIIAAIGRLVEGGYIKEPHFEKDDPKGSFYQFEGEEGFIDGFTVAAQCNPRITSALVKVWNDLENEVTRRKNHELAREVIEGV